MAEPTFMEMLTDGSFFSKIIVVMIAIQFFLYGLGEALTRISVMTESKTDNKWAQKISGAAWILGALISKFGYSVPKLVLEEKAKELGEKKGD